MNFLYHLALSMLFLQGTQCLILGRKLNKLGFKMHEHIIFRAKPRSNIVYSPISIGYIIGLVYPGLENNNQFKIAELLEMPPEMGAFEIMQQYYDLELILEYDEHLPQRGTDIKLASALFIREGLRLLPRYLDIIEDFLRADVLEANFVDDPYSAWVSVREWISNVTNSMLDAMPMPFSSTTITAFFNCLYMKAKWRYPFRIRNTKIAPFYIEPGRSIDTAMMHLNDKPLHIAKIDSIKSILIKLPFADLEKSMMILLPDEGESLEQIMQNINPDMIASHMDKMKMYSTFLSMPKFEVMLTINMKQIFQQIGLDFLFVPKLSGLKPMFGSNGYYLQTLLQSTRVKVNEFGVEAASASIAITTLAKMPEMHIDINRPFMFFIHCSRSQSMLFVGAVYRPTSEPQQMFIGLEQHAYSRSRSEQITVDLILLITATCLGHFSKFCFSNIYY